MFNIVGALLSIVADAETETSLYSSPPVPLYLRLNPVLQESFDLCVWVLETGPQDFTWTEVTNLLLRYNACRKLPL